MKEHTSKLQQQDGRLIRPKDIIADMKTMYGIHILYSKAHQALQYVLSLTYGTREETFKLLASFGYVLEQQNSRTINDLQCDEDGFWRCMRPVIAVDGTHLKGRFGDTMFVATTQYGNEKVYLITFGHIYENIKKRFHRKDEAAIMDKAARSYIELKYNRHMEELHKLHQNAFNYVIEVGPHEWSCVHCSKRRHPSSWVVPADIAEQVVLNPLSRRQAGYPRGGRDVLSSERITTQSCRRCGQSGFLVITGM
ncbi:hypothetical protein Ddye_005123 [Dipteronia dyeriana]|uniref:Uncharacterized protein n=1 Tax=Dipteronia dyeriana TaxID=168575 RepID=A0AAD9XFJ4_9ROSI|nr:hypothetical protein Ddye_005123 [Dipteronia dyeriana]